MTAPRTAAQLARIRKSRARRIAAALMRETLPYQQSYSVSPDDLTPGLLEYFTMSDDKPPTLIGANPPKPPHRPNGHGR